MIKIKRSLSVFFIIISSIFIILYISDKKNISNVSVTNKNKILIKDGNEYTKSYDYTFFKQDDNYDVYEYDDLINIFYKVLNQGWEEFTFYCDNSYVNCINDVSLISNDEDLLSNISNYVHPYNSYSSVKTSYDDTGEVTITVNYIYTEDEIEKINNEVERIINELEIDNLSSNREKIKTIHDYIVNNTKYDVNKADKLHSDYDSSRITGVLFEHYGVCSGYADTMALFLENMGIKNFKVSSNTHVWNAVYLDNDWYHLDVTWDDPVSKNGTDSLTYNYFLITNEELKEKQESYDEHIFNQSFYLELKENNEIV